MSLSEKACDYTLSSQDVDHLLGTVSLPAEFRILLLQYYVKTYGADALVQMFAQFIGLANAVVTNNRTMIETELVAHGILDAAEPLVANLPELFGALNGLKLATHVVQENLCGTCAFRIGTYPNQSASTTCNADWEAHPGEGVFVCHEKPNAAGEMHQPCEGWVQERKRRMRQLKTPKKT